MRRGPLRAFSKNTSVAQLQQNVPRTNSNHKIEIQQIDKKPSRVIEISTN